MAVRTERVVQYRRMVKRTVVDALRQVFTNAFPEKQLRGLRITTEYPLTRTDYPAIIVRFNDHVVRNAGIGHSELFYDLNGVLREWYHRLFEGTLSLTAVGLSPLDRDILADAIIETLSFGQLPYMSLQANFFTRIYDYDFKSVLSHLVLNTDEIDSSGEQVGLAPWQAEDDMVYEATYDIEIHGGFYNSPPDAIIAGTEFVTDVFVYPEIRNIISLPIVWPSEDDWGLDSDLPTADTLDVSLIGQPIGIDSHIGSDNAIATMIGAPSGIEL